MRSTHRAAAARTSAGLLTAAACCWLLIGSACDNPDFQAHPTESPIPATTAASETPMATPTAPEPSASGAHRLGVRRGSGDIDWQVRVAFTDGKVRPPAGTLDAMGGATIRLTLSSDLAGEITVSGDKGATTKIPAGGKASVTFTAVRNSGAMVRLESAGVLLLMVRVA